MISCDGNKCIPPHKLCDGENDCDDGLDEQGNCTSKILISKKIRNSEMKSNSFKK